MTALVRILVMEKTKPLMAISVVIKTTRTLSASILHFLLCIPHRLTARSGRFTLRLPFQEDFWFARKWETAVFFRSFLTHACSTFPLYYSFKQEKQVLLAGWSWHKHWVGLSSGKKGSYWNTTNHSQGTNIHSVEALPEKRHNFLVFHHNENASKQHCLPFLAAINRLS